MPKFFEIDRVELSFCDERWPFADAKRNEINAHFAKRRQENPHLWNGRVLLLRNPSVAGSIFRGACFPVDYASFLAWHDWDFVDRSVLENVAQGALMSADGAFLLGVMNKHTANPGAVHFPAGLPDLHDILESTVDLGRNVLRELEEETGLTSGDVAVGRSWHTAFHGPRIVHFKVLQATLAADPLRNRILEHLASDEHSELADVRITRSPADLGPDVFPLTAAFLRRAWRQNRYDFSSS